MTKLRAVFIGQNGDLTTAPLRAVGAAHSLIGIVESAPRGWTPPSDQPSPNPIRRFLGRARRRLIPPPPAHKSVLRSISEASNVPFFFLTRNAADELNEFVNRLRPDILCVASMSQLLHPATCALARLGAINLHPSALPKYRGPNPWFWQYYYMERVGGVTVHAIDEGEDTGDILAQETFSIDLGLPFASLSERAIGIGARLMVGALNDLATDRATPRPQPKDIGFPRARNVKRDEPLIDWNHWRLEHVWHVMRGTGEWLDAIPLPGGPYSGLRWAVRDMAPERVSVAPGTVSRDRQGYFVGHAEGKIRLELDTSAASRLRYYRFAIAGR